LAACPAHSAPYEAKLALACCAAIQNDPHAHSLLYDYVNSGALFNMDADLRKSMCAEFVKHLLDSKQYDYARTLLHGLSDVDKGKDNSPLSYRHQYESLPGITGGHKDFFEPPQPVLWQML